LYFGRCFCLTVFDFIVPNDEGGGDFLTGGGGKDFFIGLGMIYYAD
jgi:hypothetical protein